MQRIEKAQRWLSQDVFPLWSRQGIDPKNGSFVEALSAEANPLPVPRRAMVQARQIYAFNEAGRLGLLPKSFVVETVDRATGYFLSHYSQKSGAFIHSVDALTGEPTNLQLDLYTQAFSLFGLANAYGLLQQPALKTRAVELVQYLRSARSTPAGGFTEFVAGQPVYQSNPHMHLFEAFIAWMRVDQDPLWKKLAAEVLQLCQSRFANNEAAVICEHFDESWSPLRESGLFFWEPGHQCEWAWLMMEFARAGGSPAPEFAQKIYAASEKSGVEKGFVLDEVWSNGTPKRRSSRFWPQSERIKAALSLGDAAAADQAFDALFRFFEGQRSGLWEDQLMEDGQFKKQPAKASSLYHIVNAFSEYILKREAL